MEPIEDNNQEQGSPGATATEPTGQQEQPVHDETTRRSWWRRVMDFFGNSRRIFSWLRLLNSRLYTWL